MKIKKSDTLYIETYPVIYFYLGMQMNYYYSDLTEAMRLLALRYNINTGRKGKFFQIHNLSPLFYLYAFLIVLLFLSFLGEDPYLKSQTSAQDRKTERQKDRTVFEKLLSPIFGLKLD